MHNFQQENIQKLQDTLYYKLPIPADTGRKPASPTRGSWQRLNAGENRLRRWRVHAG